MARLILNNQGFVLAKAGFNADTADEEDLLVSPNGSVLQVFMSGIVTPSFITVPYGSGTTSIRLKMATVSFGVTLPTPPMAFVNGIYPGGGAGDASTHANQHTFGSTIIYEPNYYYVSYVDKLEIYCRVDDGGTLGIDGPNCNDWRYYVVENTIE